MGRTMTSEYSYEKNGAQSRYFLLVLMFAMSIPAALQPRVAERTIWKHCLYG